MEVQISEDIAEHLRRIAKRTGVEEKELVKRALKLYFRKAKSKVVLKEEFEAWDKLSDEALENFESRL